MSIQQAIRNTVQKVRDNRVSTYLRNRQDMNRFKNTQPMKRLLAVYDYGYMPWSIGDMMVFICAAEERMKKCQCDKIDYCIINHLPKSKNTNLTEKNKEGYVFQFMPLLQLSPNLGSVVCLDSQEEFFRYFNFRDNIVMYPDMLTHLSQSIDIFREHGYLINHAPMLHIPELNKSHVKRVYDKFISPYFLVTVTLRSNPDKCVRNADLKEWKIFFKKLHQWKFMVIGTQEEQDRVKELGCKNVYLSKDYGSSLMDDLAFIAMSYMYIGTHGGMSIIARTNKVPFLLFQMEKQHIRSSGMNMLSSCQKVYPGKFTWKEMVVLFNEHTETVCPRNQILHEIQEDYSYPARVDKIKDGKEYETMLLKVE